MATGIGHGRLARLHMGLGCGRKLATTDVNMSSGYFGKTCAKREGMNGLSPL